eukprot:m.95865 g.95865  ORF g.95865 m.95865 type:complete len:703 (+) comp36876_c0_seq1:21-2129(+)
MAEPNLFSLELVVDFVDQVRVPCFVPAVAFRLLDMPTVMVYVLEQNQVSKLRKHSKAVGNRIPTEVHNLRQSGGRFSFGNGKSCLFKMSFNELSRNLSATPLYLMLADVWNDPACLLGSAAIRLDRAVKELGISIADKGLAIPAAFGERGVYSLYNLMGSKVADIRLAYRLYSLGPVLESHVMKKSIGSEEKDIEIKEELPEEFRDDRVVGLVKSESDSGEVYVANTLCPPPMYYNSQSVDPPDVRVTQSLSSGGSVVTAVEEESDKEQPVDLQTENEHWKTLISRNPNAFPLIQNIDQDDDPPQDGKEEEDSIQPLHFPSQFSFLNGLLSELQQLVSHHKMTSEKSESAKVEVSVDTTDDTKQNSPPLLPKRGSSPPAETLSRLTSLVYHQLLQERKEREKSVRIPKASAKPPKRPPAANGQKEQQLKHDHFHSQKLCGSYHNLTYFAQFPKKERAPSKPSVIPFAHKRRVSTPAMKATQANVKSQSPALKTPPTKQTGNATQSPRDSLSVSSSSSSKSSAVNSASSSSGAHCTSSGGLSKRSFEIRVPSIVLDVEFDEKPGDFIPERSPKDSSPGTEGSTLHVEDLLSASAIKLTPPSPISEEDSYDNGQPWESSLPKIASISDLKPIGNAEAEDAAAVYSDDFERKSDSTGSDSSSLSSSSGSVHQSGYSSSISSVGSAQPVVKSVQKLTVNANFGYTL